ncbi:MAG: putative oxidoreductase [Alphaproteobacteria bacterium]|jgi:putative oxidoreductase|nr:putative oxidoreductase [Alphaproteobacteria bacterium]
MIDETNNIDERRLIIPGLAGVYGIVAPLGYATIRVLVALVLLPGGIDKVFYGGAARIATGNITSLGLPLPYAWAWAVACIEFFGSIMLALGLFTRPLAVAMTTMLAVIAFGIMVKRGMFWTTGGLEVALLLGLVTLAFVIGGGGRYSLDRVIGREF